MKERRKWMKERGRKKQSIEREEKEKDSERGRKKQRVQREKETERKTEIEI